MRRFHVALELSRFASGKSIVHSRPLPDRWRCGSRAASSAFAPSACSFPVVSIAPEWAHRNHQEPRWRGELRRLLEPGNQPEERLLGVAQDHHGVGLEEELIVDTRKPGVHAAL